MEKRRDMGEKTGIVIAGAAILDVVAVSVGPEVFLTGSSPTDGIWLSTGGDALNEATVLAHLARSMDAGSLQVSLLTALGDDMAGRLILRHCGECGISVGEGAVRKKMDTGINVVLVQKGGERNFLTDPNGSLRRLSKEDILDQLPQKADIFCMASIFVSPILGAEELEELFGECKRRGMLVCADMTRPKNGETVEAMGKALRCHQEGRERMFLAGSFPSDFGARLSCEKLHGYYRGGGQLRRRFSVRPVQRKRCGGMRPLRESLWRPGRWNGGRHGMDEGRNPAAFHLMRPIRHEDGRLQISRCGAAACRSASEASVSRPGGC